MGHSAEGSDKKRFLSELFGSTESLPVLLLTLFIALLYAAGPDLRSAKYVIEPPWLLFTLNTVFITGLCLLIAALCFRSFLRGGFLNVLLLGCGVLTFGLSSFAAGWLIRPPYGPNYTVTAHNIGVLFTAVLYFLSSLFTAFGLSLEIERRRGMIAAAACSAVFLLGAVLTAETMRQVLPPFFIVGEGPTVTRQVVLSVSVTFLLTSALLLMTVYAERKTGFVLYSINALILIGAGIVGVALAVPGSPLSWLGRAAQYLGDVYLAIASMKALEAARSSGTTVERALANFFRRSETHYRALIDMAADAIAAIDQEGRLILMNPAAEETTGYSLAEAFGQNLGNLIVPEQSRALFFKCLSDASREVLELRRKDGSIFPAELSCSPEIKSYKGSERTIIIRNVTERRWAEEALRESESRFRTLAGATFEGVAITESGRFTDINEQFCKISGFDRSELLGMDVRKLVHPDDRERVLGNIIAGRESAVEHRMIRKDGSLIMVEAHGKTVRHDGRDRRLTAVRDVTDARKAEEAIRSAALFPIQNPSPILRVHRDGTLLFSNPAAGPVLEEWRAEGAGVIPGPVLQTVEAVLNEGVSKKIEIPIAGRDFSFVVTPIADNHYANLYGWDVTKSKRAEEALRESEERLRLAAQAAGFGTYDGDPATGWTYWSPELRALFGLSPEEPPPVHPNAPSTFIHPEDRDRVHRAIQASLDPRGSGLLDEEHRIRRATGEWRWVQVKGRTSFSGDGEERRPLRATGIVLDITEWKRAEEALRENEERYRGLFESMNEGFALHELLCDENGEPCDYRYLDVNPAFERQTGLKREDVVGKTVLEVMPGTEPLWIKRYGEVALTGTPAHFESRSSVLGRDYEIFAYRPAPGQFAVIFMDITDRRRAGEALRQSEARYRSYIEVTGQMGWTTNADGELVDDVPAFRHYTGQSLDEMRGSGWSKAIHPDDVEIALAVWRKAVEEKQSYETEYRLRRHDGVYRYFLARGVPVLNDAGGLREWVGTCIDITERRIQEEELRKLNRTLRALSRSNEALMRAEEESAFLEEVCRIIIQDCGYAMVWIGYAADDEDKAVRPVAHAGFSAGYLETLNLTWEDGERGRGPTGTAIRTGKPILCTDMLTDPRFAPWRDEAVKRGYASSLALPLLDGGRAFGAVTIYSPEPDPFSAEEIKLLSEMADDLTYGIASLRLRLLSRQTLEALQGSEARFRQLADSMPQLVWTAEPDGRLDYFNSRLSSFTTRGPWRPCVYAEDHARTVETWKSAVRTGSPYEIEHRLQLADGRYRWFLTRAVPVPDETGRVRKWYGTSTDVDDRRRAEEEREIARIEAITEKNRIEALMEALPVGVAMVDESGGNVRSNIMYERIWGEPRPEARSINDYDNYKAWWIDSGRQVQPDEWASARAVKKGEAVTGQMMRIERFDGATAFVMNGAVPIRDVDGKITGSAVAILDITERIKAEEALRRSEARFRLLSNTAGSLLSADDPQGLINELCRDVMEHLHCQAFFNFMVDERAGRLRLNACAGIPEEEVRKLEWLDYGVAVCGCDARDRTRIIAEDIFHAPDVRTELVRSYGIQAYCCHPLKAQDRLIGTLSFGTKTRARFTPEEVEMMRNVADLVAIAMQRIQVQQELRNNEEALRRVNEELEQRVRERTSELILTLEDLEKSRDDLRRLASELVLTEERERKKISVTLHDEVAQTLAAARMRIDLLRGMPGGDEARSALDEAQRLLVQAIRETRSLMTDISNPVLYDMGLQVAVQSLAEDVKARNGISFASSFSGSLKALGQDMEVMIFQVVKELVQNIVKHSGARKASIGIVEERDDIRVVVTDDGLGFDAGNVGKVGMDGGFGLFSIRERVKSYNGRIKIESVPGKGSEVTVMLPKKAAGRTKTRRRKEQV
jgi:PAS domain S-box-containing protein